MAISVQTFSGKVTLTGAVDTPEQRRAAEETAKSVKGVTGVNNNLEIKKIGLLAG
jgi:osmotically-inducible protein OsmY